MLKTLSNLLKQSKEPYKIPRRVQDVIPIHRIWEDGIFLCGNQYCRTWRFSDINYQVASEEDKKFMFLDYSELLNSLPPGSTVKVTTNNRTMNRTNFEQEVLMPMKKDVRDRYRSEYNDVIMEKATAGNGIIQEKYITVSVPKKSIEEARSFFSRVGTELTAHYAALGSKCVELDATEKLRVLYDFYRQGEETYFHFDMRDMMQKGHSFIDYICPDYIEKHSDYLILGGKYCRTLYLKDYANYIRDSFISELTDLDRNMMLSIDIVPIPTDEAVREVENRLLGVETNITNWQRRQNSNNNFSAVIPYDMELQRKESKEFLDDLTARDQRMMLGILTMVLTADSKEQLDVDTDRILSLAGQKMCQMAVLKYQQIDGLNTVLPIGTRKINVFRTLTTESLAVFMPFKVQEIQEKGGIYFGENAISHNLILCNKANLLNQASFYLGVPGAGKSFLVKELIIFLILNTEDDILICDPEGEFAPLVNAMGKDIGTVIHVAAGGKDRLNAMYMVEGYGETNPLVEKSQFTGVHSDTSHCNQAARRTCIFEYIYFARPDSVIDGVSVHQARQQAGACLAKAYPVEADVVVGVPDSGLDAALGYARASGIPYGIGLVKNKYIGRTFISPGQDHRTDQVRIKLSPVESEIRGKRVVLIDDSIVRGTTSGRIVKLLRDAGAVQIHMRVSAPPFLFPCYYGTDIDSQEHLIACHHSTEEIARMIGVDSLGYLPLTDLTALTGNRDYCSACFDGSYCTAIPTDTRKDQFEQKLSQRKCD